MQVFQVPLNYAVFDIELRIMRSVSECVMLARKHTRYTAFPVIIRFYPSSSNSLYPLDSLYNTWVPCWGCILQFWLNYNQITNTFYQFFTLCLIKFSGFIATSFNNNNIILLAWHCSVSLRTLASLGIATCSIKSNVMAHSGGYTGCDNVLATTFDHACN